MKTVATVVVVLAFLGLFGKHKKHPEPPPPGSQRPPVVQAYYGCAQKEQDKPRVQRKTAQHITKLGSRIYRRPVVTQEVLNEVSKQIIVYAKENCIEPELGAALIARESAFNPNAVSPSGAKGLGQLIDSTASRFGVTDSFDIKQNLHGSFAYIRELMDMFEGNPRQVQCALYSYLKGPRTAQANHCDYSNDGTAVAYINDILDYRDKMIAMRDQDTGDDQDQDKDPE